MIIFQGEVIAVIIGWNWKECCLLNFVNVLNDLKVVVKEVYNVFNQCNVNGTPTVESPIQ